jgi:N-acetylglucosamine-6-phosphate deacetylase
VSVIADLVHTHPVFVRLAMAAKGARRVALVTDAVATADAPPTPGVLRAPPRLSDGTLAGSTMTMERAVSNAVTHSGVTLPDALRCASTTPAGLLGLHDRGEIAPGRRADLVALEPGTDGGWRVASTWVAGIEAWGAAR